MIFHPVVFWIIFSILLIIALFPFLLLFAAWCESFRFHGIRDFVHFAKQIFILTLPASLFPLLCCIVWLSDSLPHLYIIDTSNEVKNRYYLFYDSDCGVTPQFETYYIKNQSGKTIYEYEQGYSNASFLFSIGNGIVSEIKPGEIATLSKKPYSLMKGVPEKIVVSYRIYRPSESTETFIITEKQLEELTH